jgi:S-adenosylmethionine:tRNA ribosyltransferase-isomerase
LESSLNQFENNFQPIDQWVTKVIYEPYEIQSCDMLLTNFVENKTCQYISAAVFCGSKLLKKAYQEALKNEYDFLMFGDSLLIVKESPNIKKSYSLMFGDSLLIV